MQFQVCNRFTGAAQFTADIGCAKGTIVSERLGLAVCWALKNKVNLNAAYLRGANLIGAKLDEAYLRGADLSEASLIGANLIGADLSEADLSGAYLSAAKLDGAYLRGAYLRGALSIVSFGPVGKERRIGYAVAHDDGPRVQLGCFWGTLAEACAAIRAQYGANSTYENLVRAACAVLMENSQ